MYVKPKLMKIIAYQTYVPISIGLLEGKQSRA